MKLWEYGENKEIVQDLRFPPWRHFANEKRKKIALYPPLPWYNSHRTFPRHNNKPRKKMK